MPRKKPTRQLTDAEREKFRVDVRSMVAEKIESLPFIRLDSPVDIRRELDDIKASLPRSIREAMKDLRPSQSELYARKLRP